METFDKDQTVVQAPRFCPECGQAAGNANFCPACGHNMGFTASNTVADTNLRPPSGGGQRSRGRAGFVIAGGVLALAAIAVAVIILLNHKSSSATTASANASVTYRQQLHKVLTPVITANQTVSNSLIGLNGEKTVTNSAKTQTAQALAALTTARGGLSVLHVPAADTALAGHVQQAISADSGYLQAVSSTLATPTGSGGSQLQTLSTGAQTAMVNLDPIVSGASASITGTSNLVSWNHGAVDAHKAAVQKARKAAQASGSSASSGSAQEPPAQSQTTPAPTPPGLASCDQNISVNASTTTCGFADAVFAQYADAVQENGGPVSTTVTATSAATGDTYNDYCAYNSTNQLVQCSHGTDLIEFPEWAAAVYNG